MTSQPSCELTGRHAWRNQLPSPGLRRARETGVPAHIAAGAGGAADTGERTLLQLEGAAEGKPGPGARRQRRVPVWPLPHRLGEILDHPGCQQREREHEEARPGDAHPVELNVGFESGVVLGRTRTPRARGSSGCQDDRHLFSSPLFP